jgi:hypothetical protein
MGFKIAERTRTRGIRTDNWFTMQDYRIVVGEPEPPEGWPKEQHTTWKIGPFKLRRRKHPQYCMGFTGEVGHQFDQGEAVFSDEYTHWSLVVERQHPILRKNRRLIK